MRGPQPPHGRNLELTRRARRLSALRALGIGTDAVQALNGHVEAAARQNQIQQLPEQQRVHPAQDPVTGQFAYLYGWSDPFGPDLFF